MMVGCTDTQTKFFTRHSLWEQGAPRCAVELTFVNERRSLFPFSSAACDVNKVSAAFPVVHFGSSLKISVARKSSSCPSQKHGKTEIY